MLGDHWSAAVVSVHVVLPVGDHPPLLSCLAIIMSIGLIDRDPDIYGNLVPSSVCINIAAIGHDSYKMHV